MTQHCSATTLLLPPTGFRWSRAEFHSLHFRLVLFNRNVVSELIVFTYYLAIDLKLESNVIDFEC